MLKLSIHKIKSLVMIVVFSLPTSACFLETAVDTNYTPTVPGYAEVRRQSTEGSGQKASEYSSSAYRVQNPRKVPVIINDPFGQSAQRVNAAAIAPAYNGFNTVYANQPNRSYGSLANSEQNFIRGNVLMQNNTPIYPAPTFGQNIYTPSGR